MADLKIAPSQPLQCPPRMAGQRPQNFRCSRRQGYGWNNYTPEMPDEEILRRLLALNQARGARQS